MPAKRLEIFLRGLPEALLREVREVAELQRAYAAIVPRNLAPFSHVAAFHAGRVTLLTNSGIFASKIKQLMPRFLSEFRQRGFDINAIEVRVQVRSSRAANQMSDKIPRQISAQGLKSLARLEANLTASPLRAAVSDLLAKQRKRCSAVRR